MERIYLITGASGHLGRNLMCELQRQHARVRALLLPGEAVPPGFEGVEVVRGDVTDPASLEALFDGLAGAQTVVIHAAAIVEIKSEVSPALQRVNVEGTAHMVECALRHGVHRFLHVSSVHAIPEAPAGRTIRETRDFSPAIVAGGYAKTKAEASAYVLAAVQRGLPAVILHPSGIIGPLDPGRNHIVTGLRAFLAGHIPACPKGGYDLVDARDVAQGILAAADKGRVGETYILSGRYCEMRELFRLASAILHRRFRCPAIPGWMAQLAAPVIEWHSLRKGRQPLVTPYSLFALSSNSNFTHEKASRELGYWPRELYETLCDTIQDLRAAQPQKRRRAPRRRAKATA